MAYKLMNDSGGPEDLISMAVDEINEVKGELEEWRDGMQGSNLENSEKFSALEEAISQLETFDSFSAPDEWPHADAKVVYHYSVNKRKKRGPSRAVRIENAVAKVSAVVEFYQGLDDAEDHADLITELEQLVIEVEVPGMYG